MARETLQGPVPFSVSDVFAYVIPGATLLAAITLFEHRLLLLGKAAMHMPVWRTFANFANAVATRDDAILSFLFGTGLAVAAYVVGHITSSVSSFFLDRILMFKAHGYPYRYLLNLQSGDKNRPGSNHSLFYRGSFFWLNVWTLAVFWFAVKGTWLSLVTVGMLAAWLGFFSIFKFSQHNIPHRRKTLARRAWRRIHTWFRARQVSLRRHRMHSRNPIIKELFRTLARGARVSALYSIHAAPYNLMAMGFTKFTNSQDSLEPSIQDAYKKSFRTVFNLNPEQLRSSNYWLVVCDVLERSAEFRQLLNNWLRLYEFSRNLGTAFYLAFVYCLTSLLWQRQWIRRTDEPFDYVLVLAPLALYFLSFVMFGRYYYLYVCYYSKFIFRAFVYLHKDTKPQTP